MIFFHSECQILKRCSDDKLKRSESVKSRSDILIDVNIRKTHCLVEGVFQGSVFHTGEFKVHSLLFFFFFLFDLFVSDFSSSGLAFSFHLM